MFKRIKGKLYWIDVDGNPIGPLNPSTPTCGDYEENQP